MKLFNSQGICLGIESPFSTLKEVKAGLVVPKHFNLLTVFCNQIGINL